MRRIAWVLLGTSWQASAPAPVAVVRVAGVDAASGIAYVLLSTSGKASGAEPGSRLTAQCTRSAAGKLKFELLADLGKVPELVYYPPWHPTRSGEFPPQLRRAQVTMEFLGYTHVKPLKRQWEYLDEAPAELRYSYPGGSSANMEPPAYFLQYLRALPTLRLTVPEAGAAEWETTAWQQAIHAEPLCAAAGR